MRIAAGLLSMCLPAPVAAADDPAVSVGKVYDDGQMWLVDLAVTTASRSTFRAVLVECDWYEGSRAVDKTIAIANNIRAGAAGKATAVGPRAASGRQAPTAQCRVRRRCGGLTRSSSQASMSVSSK